ncbi:MAG TPA: amidohydrolase family protein [Candidatus Binataceae bacterium]
MLKVHATEVPAARYPIVDIHQHVNDAMGLGERVSPQRLVELMDKCNLKTLVILTGMWGEKLQSIVNEMIEPYPGRFAVFTQIDWSDIDASDFTRTAVGQLRDSVARGARGLKIHKDLGLKVRERSGNLLAIDDVRLDPIWEECGSLGIPVGVHVGDPDAFFFAVDGANERYEELTRFPEWRFDGAGLPSKESILAARERVFNRHPETIFIALHMAEKAEDLDYVSSVLDRFPNVLIEFGARQAELGRQPRHTRELFLKFQDRILFGSDHTPDEEMYRSYFRWLETDDEYFEYWAYPSQGRWRIYGLNLPHAALDKIYHLNAEAMFSHFKGRSVINQLQRFQC